MHEIQMHLTSKDYDPISLVYVRKKKLEVPKSFTSTCIWMYIIFTMSMLFRYTRRELCEYGCCLGFVWSQKHNSCIPCSSGYHGVNCSSVCSHPYFGNGCRKKCNCSQNDCDHEYGCKMSPEDCDIGFQGEYCELPCRFPSYGYLCQKSCNCEEKSCNFTTGCKVDSPTIEQPSTSPSEETTLTVLSSVSVSKSDSSDDSQHLCQNNTSSHRKITQEKRILLIFGIIFLMTSSALMLAANVFINIQRPRS